MGIYPSSAGMHARMPHFVVFFLAPFAFGNKLFGEELSATPETKVKTFMQINLRNEEAGI